MSFFIVIPHDRNLKSAGSQGQVGTWVINPVFIRVYGAEIRLGVAVFRNLLDRTEFCVDFDTETAKESGRQDPARADDYGVIFDFHFLTTLT
jgi:hypothetical protein